MPAFAYQALSADGAVKAGSIEAADRGDALRQLARRGLQARSIQAQTAEHAGKKEALDDLAALRRHLQGHAEPPLLFLALQQALALQKKG